MTATQALRQCIEAMKLVDFKDCGESDELWKQINDAQANAERVLREGEKQEAVAWAAESTTGACVRMLTKISLLESEVDRYVNRSDIAAIGCNRVKVPLYRAAPQPPAAPSGDVEREAALSEAVAALYFNDNSEYEGALWSIVHQLSPSIHELLQKDPHAAYVAVKE